MKMVAESTRSRVGAVLLLFVFCVSGGEASAQPYVLNRGDIKISYPPHATIEQRRDAVRRYLTSIAGRGVISGQFIGHRSGDLSSIRKIFDDTGKWLGAIGGDYYGPGAGMKADFSFNGTAIRYWNSGGLIHLSFHPPNPDGLGDSWAKKVNGAALVTPGSETFKRHRAVLKQLADGIEVLRDGGVVVILRLYHEQNGNWFWWGTGISPQQYITLWRQTYDYLAQTRNLRNIIWFFCPGAGADLLATYPGSRYVDVVGVDYYDTNFSELIEDYRVLLSMNKVIGIGEFGAGLEKNDNNFDQRKLAEAFRTEMPKIAFWQQWWERWGMRNNKFVKDALSTSGGP